jgi:hypothetical protein
MFLFEVTSKKLCHSDPSFLSANAIAAQDRAQATGVMTSKTVGVSSSARRNRNHQVEIIRRNVLAGTSARLRATKPKPPPCNKRSVDLKARSRLLLQRTHNN